MSTLTTNSREYSSATNVVCNRVPQECDDQEQEGCDNQGAVGAANPPQRDMYRALGTYRNRIGRLGSPVSVHGDVKDRSRFYDYTVVLMGEGRKKLFLSHILDST